VTAPGHAWLGAEVLAAVEDQTGTPVFVYSEARIRQNLHRILDAAERCQVRDRLELFIPFFPNANPHLYSALREAGLGFLVQLPSEHELLVSYGFDRFIVSPGHVSDDEIRYWVGTGHPVFLASLDEVAFALETEISAVNVRIDTLQSGKPGIKRNELGALADLVRRHGRTVDGVEVYSGSGNSLDEMVRSGVQVFDLVRAHFPEVGLIDFAGGQGFDYGLWDADAKHFDWCEYLGQLADGARRAGIPESTRFMFEPARDVLADSGALLLSVQRDLIRTEIGNILVTDGSRTLMPSAQQRERRHNVVVLDDRLQAVPPGPCSAAAVRGRTILKNDYLLPGEYPVPEDVGRDHHLLVLDVGAYCATQHMEFLSVPPAPEVLVRDDGSIDLISAAGDAFDRWRNVLPQSKVLAGPGAVGAAGVNGAGVRT
jgi:diaminopimelate decarboxylase